MGIITLHKTCYLCGKNNDIEVDEIAYSSYVRGYSVQVAFAAYDENVREGIRNGSHGECYDKAFVDPSDKIVTFEDRQQAQADLTQWNGPEDHTFEEGGNLYTSKLKDPAFEEYRAPILDLDIPHTYVPSTTEGHGHLYLNILLNQEEEDDLLETLAKYGIVEYGFRQASQQRGFTAVRKPGVVKTDEERAVTAYPPAEEEKGFLKSIFG